MKLKKFAVAFLALSTLPMITHAAPKGPKPFPDIAAPSGLSCMLGEGSEPASVDVWWNQVEDFANYHVDFECSYTNEDGSEVELEVDPENLLIICMGGGEESEDTCHTSVAIDPNFLVDTESDEDELLDLTLSGACKVSVKVKNTPGPRQNNAKTKADCDFSVPEAP